ncbi:hypothetical protein LCGC14_1266240 [marine sediment metagenome]|uniref:Malectin domain-containing protein n=1 Tax=marine sediment metagenome TaxID=412755 RepID=A0A0F9L1F5_9ZZZZ
MFYSFTHTVTTADIVTAKKRLELPLTAGVIHQVDMLFQDGANHEVNIQIFYANFQLWPSNRGATIKGNATVVSFREFYELTHGSVALHAFIWGDGVVDDIDVVINVGLLPKAILQPLSFDELLAAASGLR